MPLAQIAAYNRGRRCGTLDPRGDPARPVGPRGVEGGKQTLLILKKQAVHTPAGAGGRAPARNTGANVRLADGTILQGRYRVVEPLGQGGMSMVYKALDLHFTNVERVCAVKEMFDFAADDATRQSRL